MATIQFYPAELNYVNAQIRTELPVLSFLNLFLEACLRADAENYEIIRPSLLIFMEKYPASIDWLRRPANEP